MTYARRRRGDPSVDCLKEKPLCPCPHLRHGSHAACGMPPRVSSSACYPCSNLMIYSIVHATDDRACHVRGVGYRVIQSIWSATHTHAHARTLLSHSSHRDIIVIIVRTRSSLSPRTSCFASLRPCSVPLVIPFSSPFPASAALEPPKGKRRLGGALSLLSGATIIHHRCVACIPPLVATALSGTRHAGAASASYL
jgi:hypothetical protein